MTFRYSNIAHTLFISIMCLFSIPLCFSLSIFFFLSSHSLSFAIHCYAPLSTSLHCGWPHKVDMQYFFPWSRILRPTWVGRALLSKGGVIEMLGGEAGMLGK
ncbi:dubious [Schizosaccharomyces pombe]|uniref:Putative uncharacterized protein C32H8.15 n=1 Tax=Schizosaccharomyces pombe (strain 972 / ATCC 24843) TaxID=284812 RepID=YNHF_SCHPO|nr:uncharacterized protein SPBC32H8.15 [Schizosaccharomyces pombe]G2TRQ1.1 RecName: Full=Putative uncharacterized protein C32H8.15 [Schizosaccharomyces pombe 972h-]CCD31361.1 dubious [Schizosaccharomyces pombe]|eukprot:NP_001343151.1 uncharacterized protein SPBC32H8.15 [Schizosaccharomyces pombe]